MVAAVLSAVSAEATSIENENEKYITDDSQLKSIDIKWDSYKDFVQEFLPRINLYEFFTMYWKMCEKFKNRHYHRALKRPEPGPFKYRERADKDPTVRGNLISDSWVVTWEFIFNPNEKTFWKIFAVYTSYFLMPLVGGYIRAETTI